MVISLVSRGVVSGIALVLAKYWYDRREGKDRLQAADGNAPTESASPLILHPSITVAGINVRAESSASSTTPALGFEAGSEGSDKETARDFRADGVSKAAPEAVSGDSTDSVGHGRQPPVAGTVREIYRGEKGEKKDEHQRVDDALASCDLSMMTTVLEDIGDPVLRNRLLRRLVNGHYRRRSDAFHRAAFYRVALLQMEEASSILEGIEETGEPRPQSLEAFKSMAIALDEDGSPDGAIAVCEMALSLGLQDGTKSGFEGRITRLRRRQKPTETGDAGIGPGRRLH